LETLKETALKAAIAAEESEDDDGHKKADRKKLPSRRLARKQARKVAKARGSAYAEMEARTKRIAN
jgi:hypothetical protein